LSADDADVTIGLVSELDELRAVAALFDALWQRTTPAMPPELFRALTHAGNYAAAATSEGRLVGGLVGFLGWHEGEPTLHSHILGVVPELQGRGVGAALKLHQRGWARERGLATITWTFDPLVRRNARFNLSRLGARAVAYLPDFYGPMEDTFNAGVPTDRLLVEWPTTPHPAPEPPAQAETQAERISCPTPPDIVALRRSDPEAARDWGARVRERLGGAMAAGYEVEGLDDDGAYVLRR
jgi:predicted GNAT superfamily acetyltransferase